MKHANGNKLQLLGKDRVRHSTAMLTSPAYGYGHTPIRDTPSFLYNICTIFVSYVTLPVSMLLHDGISWKGWEKNKLW